MDSLYGLIALCFFLVGLVLIVFIIWKLWLNAPVDQRIKRLSGGIDERKNQSFKHLAEQVGKFSGKDSDISGLKKKLVLAGMREKSAPYIFEGARAMLSLLFFVIAWLITPSHFSTMTYILSLMLMATVGFYLPGVILSNKIKQRKILIENSLPDMVDLLSIAVDAGLGFDMAMQRVSNKLEMKNDLLAKEFRETYISIQTGVPRSMALQTLSERNGVEALTLLVSLISSTDRLGVPIGSALHHFARSMRERRFQKAEETANKLPAKMTFPLVACIFPVLLIMLGGPGVVGILRSFTAMSGH